MTTILTLTLLAGAGSLHAQEPRPPVPLDDPLARSSPSGTGLVHAGDGATRVAAWLDDRVSGSDEDLYASVSTDHGLSWSAEVALTQGSGAAIDVDGPQAAVADGVVHLLYDDDRNGSDDTLSHARSADGGLSWTTQVLVDGSTSARIAAEEDTVVVLYTQRPNHGSRDELWSLWSFDQGQSFGSPLPVDPDNQGDYDVDAFEFVLEELVAHCAFEDDRNGTDDLWFATTTLAQPWSDPIRLDEDPTGIGNIASTTSNSHLAVAAHDWTIHVLWQEDGRHGTHEQLYYKRSTTLGTTWEPEMRVGASDPDVDDVDTAALACDAGRALIAWTDDRDGDLPVRVLVSEDAGSTWLPETILALTGGGGQADALFAACERGWMVVGWEEDELSSASSDEWSLASWSRDGGASWTTPFALTSFASDEDVDQPAAAWCFDSGSLSAVWQSDQGASDGDAVFAGGFRLPWVSVELAPPVARFALHGVDQDLETGVARWACSTSLGSSPHPENALLTLGLAAGTLFDRCIDHPEQLWAPCDDQGEALGAWLEIPPVLSGQMVHVQGWVHFGGVGFEPSDVVSVTIP